MSVEIYQISFGQFEQMLGPDIEAREITLLMGKLASDIIVGVYDGRPLAYIGVTSLIISTSLANIWMLTTVEGERHPILLARYGRGLIETVLMKYPVLTGRCFNAKSANWLRWLGAEFSSETEFVFRRTP